MFSTLFESKSRFPLFQSLINNSRFDKLITWQRNRNRSSNSHVRTPKESVHVHAITSIFTSISFKNFPALFLRKCETYKTFEFELTKIAKNLHNKQMPVRPLKTISPLYSKFFCIPKPTDFYFYF